MSSHGDYDPEMTSHDPSEAETERLLNGAVQADSTGASELADALDRIRSTYGAEDPPPVSPMLSEFVDGNLIAEKGDLLVTAGSNADGPASQVAELPKRRDTLTNRRNNVLIKLSAFIGTLTGKILLGTTVAMAAVGGGQAVGVIDVVPTADSQPAAEEIPMDLDEESDTSDGQGPDDAADVAVFDLDEADDVDHMDSPDDVDEVDEPEEPEMVEMVEMVEDTVQAEAVAPPAPAPSDDDDHQGDHHDGDDDHQGEDGSHDDNHDDSDDDSDHRDDDQDSGDDDDDDDDDDEPDHDRDDEESDDDDDERDDDEESEDD
ncbi:MAG: hypothetical protein ACERLM_15970 [Acidimicrobiales bacterium]